MTKHQSCLWSYSDQKPAVFLVISIFFSATLARARTPNVYQRDTLLAKNGVTFYVSAIVRAEQRFRPQQRVSGNNVAGVTLGSVTSYITHKWQAL